MSCPLEDGSSSVVFELDYNMDWRACAQWICDCVLTVVSSVDDVSLACTFLYMKHSNTVK